MKTIDELLNEYFKNWADAGGWECNIIMANGDYAKLENIEEVARHFYELGLKAGKSD